MINSNSENNTTNNSENNSLNNPSDSPSNNLHLPTENIVRICYDTNVKNVIDYTISLFKNGKYDTVVLCGLSLAISKVILVAEIVKTKVKNLHQISNIDCLITKDKFDENKIKRVPKLDILLTTIEPKEKGMGYQQPMSENEVNLLASVKDLGDDDGVWDDEFCEYIK